MKKVLILFLSCIIARPLLAQIPEGEPNSSFATASPFTAFNNVMATVGGSDTADFFRTVFPVDGTLKIYIQCTNNSANSGYLFIQGFNRGKSQVFSQFVSSTSVPAGASVTDSITLYGQASDTAYFKFTSSQVFTYQFQYFMADQSPNDAEPNNTFATALPVSAGQLKQGHVNYISNGSTDDTYDYYRTVFPSDGTLKVYVKATNRMGINNTIFNVYGYDRRKTTASFMNTHSAIPIHATVYDTITLQGMAADTFYFRISSNNQAFSYEFSYDMTELTPNDTEPNDLFTAALPINEGETKKGHINYYANGNTFDQYDYYRTVFPGDGTMKLYVKATNFSSSNFAIFNVYGYDRRKTSTSFINTHSSIPLNTTVYDTITLQGMAADTFYFRISTNSQAFSYEIYYQMSDQGINDAEPNNSFATSLPITMGETKKGHSNYYANGSTLDPDDYYMTIFPVDGTLKVYVKGTNRAAAASSFSMNGYDRRKTATTFNRSIASSLAPGNTVYDTITVYSLAADTFYFRLFSSRAIEYEFRYAMIDTSLNDVEPNNTFAQATVLSGSQVRNGHTGYNSNGTYDQFDYYKTDFVSNDSLKLYLQATNNSGVTANFILRGYNSSQTQIYIRTHNSVPAGTTFFDSVKIAVTAPQTIYNRLESSSNGFSYQLNLSSQLPGNGFSITGPTTACTNANIYKATDVAENNVTYNWTLMSGGTLNFTDSIATVTWTTPGTHILKLYLSNAFGNSITKQIAVLVNDSVPSTAPVVTANGRFLSIASLPAGITRRWYKNGIDLGVTDSVFYAAAAGTYTGKYVNNCGAGPASLPFVFNAPQAQTITFPAVSTIGFSPDSFRVLTATASSGLPVSYKIVSGPGVLHGDSLFVTAAGNITVRAFQNGNTNYDSAAYVNQVVTVVSGPQSITFYPIPNKIYSIEDFALDAVSTSGLPVTYSIVSGPATLNGSRLKMTGAGTVTVRASQPGNVNYLAATPADRSFCIGIRQIDTIAGVRTTCPTTLRYTTKKITGAIYQWTLSGGGILITNGDTATVQWQTAGAYTLTIKAYSACDTVRSAPQSITVNILPTYVTGPVTGLIPADNETGLSMPLTLQWSAVENATSYNIYVWPASATEPALPLDSGIAQLNYVLNSNIALNIPYKWKIVAKNVCTSSVSPIQQFTVAQNSNGKPDLVLDTMSYQSVIYQAQPLTVTWRVKNNGTNSTGAATWKDRIYLSPTNDLRVSTSVLLGEYNNPSYLLPGETYTMSKTVTVPPGFAGTWFLFVITDNQEAFCFSNLCNVFWGEGRYNHHENNVHESNEYNNYRYAAVPILEGSLPDLQVKTIGVPAAAFGGSNITVTYKVKNEQVIPAIGKIFPDCPQRAWRDRFFISDQPVFSLSTAYELPYKTIRFLKPGTMDCQAEAVPYIDQLLPDSSYTLQHQVTIPYTHYGTQYIYVYTNGYNDAYEGAFNTNNIRRSDSINITLTPPADLIVSNIGNLTGVVSGQTVNILFTVTNQGANPPHVTEAGWRDSVFICSSSVFNYANVLVKARINRSCPANFGTGASYNGNGVFQIPNGTSGTYYVFVKTDAANEVFEYNQENNNLAHGNAFTVTLSPPVDMIITSISAPDTVRANIPFTLVYTLKNTGPGTVRGAWRDDFFKSTDSTLQLSGTGLVQSGINDSLLPNIPKAYSKQSVITAGNNAAGQIIYIKGKTDATNKIYEHNAENNNIAISNAVYVKPPVPDTVDRRSNIFIQSLTAPANINAGTGIMVNWSVKNKGPLATSKTYWQDRVYLSVDSTISSNDIELKRLFINQYTTTGLLADSLYQRSESVLIPLQLYGNYFIIAKTDYNENIENDSTTTDNSFLIPVTIIAPPTPDLVITPLNNLPDSIWGGSVFYLKYQVQNNGPVAATGRWYDRVYVQAAPSPLTYQFNNKEHNQSLAPGASYTDSLLVQIPVYISGPSYHFILQTDGRNDVYEGPGGENNNTHTRSQVIYPFNSRPAPDLIVSSVTVPDSAVLGKDMTTGYVITNAGIHPAQGKVNNALYLSSNMVYENSIDKMIADEELPNLILQPGQSAAGLLTGKALPATPGLQYSVVRTNVRNTLFEGTAVNNNIKVSTTATHVDAYALTVGQAKDDTLHPNEGNYYKVVVGDSLDLSVSLSTNYAAGGTNTVYVAYNRVPGELDYDASGYNPASLNQQVLVSSTHAGTYYIKAQSFGIPVNEPVSLLVTALPFSIVSLTPSVMGKGTVTGVIYGAGFKPATQILLRKNSTDYAVCFIQQFVNSTYLKVQWKLDAVPVGTYDVVAVNPGGAETVLASGVTVETAKAYQFEYTPLLPSQVRPFSGVFTYKGKNTGNVNIDVVQGDVTMIEKNATVYSVSTTGRARRYSKYVPQYDSLMKEDWYISGGTRVVPFIVRNLAPGEEFTITVETRFKGTNVMTEQSGLLPLQCRMFGYSSSDFVKDQVRNIEMMRLLFINDPRATLLPNSQLIQDGRAGSKFFAEKMLAEYVTAGLISWTDTIGTNLRWDCSRCLQLLPELKPEASYADTFAFNPEGLLKVGKASLGTGQVFGKNQRFLLEMNKGLYWWYYGGQPGQAGHDPGWDMLDINGTLNITATATDPFRIQLSSLWKNPKTGDNTSAQLPGWSPAYDTSYLIVVASGGITGYDSSKIQLDITDFAGLNDFRRGRFTTALRSGSGSGPDSIMLVWKAYKPAWGEAGVDGVDGGPGEPGSPGGVGGPGNAQNQKGGKGGKGGRGSDEIPSLGAFAQKGGRGGKGGKGYGDGGDGGDAGESGMAVEGMTVEGETGGDGDDAGPNGGNGGAGGKGGKGGASSFNARGADGGEGGKGGNGVNSSYGGRGGDGGEGGKGGAGCGGGSQGGNGGNGGQGGTGPLGDGAYGSSGRKGIAGPPIDCPHCGSVKASTPSYEDIQRNELIDYSKATYGAATGFASDGALSLRNIGIEILNQSTGEYSPGANLIVTAVDATFDVLLAGGTAEYQVAMKVTVTGMKAGDYILSKTLSPEDYKELKPVIDFLINGATLISSPADFIATGIKLLSDLGDFLNIISMTKPCDPNDITGPRGFDNERFVSAKAVMPYTIRFENDSAAEVAAQRVVVRQPIHSKADPLTFRLGNFNFGGYTFIVPENRSNYFTVLNFDSLGYRVEVSAGVDVINREAFWIMRTIDPATGLPPANALIGFLPINDSTEKGTGFVNYSIKPLTTVVTGDSITAKASIVFDVNEPIETNTWTNIIDAFPPVSNIENLPDSTADTEIVIWYNGDDDPGGSGIRSYKIYMTDNGSDTVLLMYRTIAADTTILGEAGHTYKFYAEATDNVGNRETYHFLDSVKIIQGQYIICPGSDIYFDSRAVGVSYQWQVDDGSGYVNISNGALYNGVNQPVLHLINPPTSMYGYKYRCVTDGGNSMEFLLKFGVSWEGTISTAWENPANWGCGLVPDQYTDVTIDGGKPHNVVVGSDVVIRTLRTNPGASVTVNSGFNFTILK